MNTINPEQCESKPKRRAAFARRSRLTLVLAVNVFVLVQAAIGVAIDWWRTDLRHPTFEIKYRQFARLVKQQPQSPGIVLCLGSSLTANGVDARTIEASAAAGLGRPTVAYNFATYGAGPFTNLIYTQRILRRGFSPDLVIVEVSALAYDREFEFDVKRTTPAMLEFSDLDIVERYGKQPDLRKDWWESRLVPAYGHRLSILNGSARLWLPYKEQTERWADADDHGWHGRDPMTPELYQRALPEIEARFKNRMSDYKVEPDALKALDELAALLAREKIATVMVRMPEGPLMQSYYRPALKKQLEQEFRSISAKHGAIFVDANDWLGEEHFRDSYHLHRHGARAFTQRFVAELRREETGVFQKATPRLPIVATSLQR